jgi:predicted nucleotidyltransferase
MFGLGDAAGDGVVIFEEIGRIYVMKAKMKRKQILTAISRFRDAKRDEFGIVRIGIFGSAARDEMKASSDVDVVVQLARPDLFALVGIKQDLESLLHCSVDIVRYRERMNPTLKRRIEHEVVYI